MKYSKTQKGPIQYLLYGVVAVLLPLAWLNRGEPAVVLVLAGVAVAMILAGLAFGTMTVRDEGDRLAIRYGPLPIFRRQIPYAAITAVEPGRTSVIDGWGIHYIPFRGMTYNLWGFGCAKLTLGRRVIRIGSEDIDNLVSFIRSRIEPPP